MPNTAKHLYRPLIAATLFAAAGSAHAEWSANAAMTNNYLWRGLTQSINEAAIQGGVDYADESGSTSAPGLPMCLMILMTPTHTNTTYIWICRRS